MKLNRDKCHLLVSRFKYKNIWAKIRKTKTWESKKQKLLGEEIDRTLRFDEYTATLCRKAQKSQKIYFSQIIKFLVYKYKTVLLKAFIESQFGYCPLIWVFHSRGGKNKINHLYEPSLRIV